MKEQNMYHGGQYIFREGDQVMGVFFIQSGKVKVFSSGLNGKEHIVRLASDGHILGHRGYGRERYPISAVALEDTTACFLRNELLHDAFMANPNLTYGFMMYYSSELRKSELRLKHLGQMNIREKVAEALVYLNEVFGVNFETLTLNVNLTRQEIADIAGTTAEQVTRQLTDFENENLIERHGKTIRLKEAGGLKKIISNYNKEYNQK